MYRHVQQSPVHFILTLLAAFMFVFAWQIRNDVAPSIVVIIVGGIMFVLSLSFRTLTIFDEHDCLVVRYGPLNLFGTRIPYDKITNFETGTTSVIDGWGIHYIPFRGWTLNLWGFECVKIQMGAKTMRIGTDDSENLVQFLEERIEDVTAGSKNS